jgi:hypothetical protein
VASRVELHVAGAQRRLARGSVAARERAQARHQLGEGEGLGHVVVGAQGEAVDQVVHPGCRGEHEHPAVGLLAAQRAADLVAMDDRQVAVEHHDVVRVQARLVERLLAVVGHVHRHALAPQAASHRIGDPTLVLGYKNTHSPQGSERRLRRLGAVMRR